MKNQKRRNTKRKVAIVMGSQTDLKVMRESRRILNEFKIESEILIVSAHRTPKEMMKFASAASEKYDVIIAGAGGAAHLPGMIASLTCLPVIGVPVTTTKLQGLDALLSIAQMPKGVPVATVAIDNAENAGLLAARILGLSDEEIFKKLIQFQKRQKTKVLQMNSKLKKSLKLKRG